MIPHKTYIHHIPAVAYSVCLYTQSILQSDHFHGIISAQFSALHYYFSVSISSGNRSGLLFKNAFFLHPRGIQLDFCILVDKIVLDMKPLNSNAARIAFCGKCILYAA